MSKMRGAVMASEFDKLDERLAQARRQLTGDGFFQQCLDEAYLNIRTRAGCDQRFRGQLMEMQPSQLRRTIRNAALDICRASDRETSLRRRYFERNRPDPKERGQGKANDPPSSFDASRAVYDQASYQERVAIRLLLYRYTTQAAADTVGWSRRTLLARRRAFRQRIDRYLKGTLIMSNNALTDADIYQFAQGGDAGPIHGSDNLRRWIERTTVRVQLTLGPITGEDFPIIPPNEREAIDLAIEQHRNPCKIHEILAAAGKTEESPEALAWQANDAAKRLAKGSKWISDEASIRIVQDPEEASRASGLLVEIIAKLVRLFVRCRDEAGDERQLSSILADKFARYPDRFRKTRGRGSDTDLPPTRCWPPGDDMANRWEQEKLELFHNHRADHEKRCRRMMRRDDADTTLGDFQLLADSVVLVLDWTSFDAPRYQAQALVEEVNEVGGAVSGHLGSKQDVFGEIGDAMFVALWLSNVLAIPNLGHDLLEWYKHN